MTSNGYLRDAEIINLYLEDVNRKSFTLRQMGVEEFNIEYRKCKTLKSWIEMLGRCEGVKEHVDEHRTGKRRKRVISSWKKK